MLFICSFFVVCYILFFILLISYKLLCFSQLFVSNMLFILYWFSFYILSVWAHLRVKINGRPLLILLVVRSVLVCVFFWLSWWLRPTLFRIEYDLWKMRWSANYLLVIPWCWMLPAFLLVNKDDVIICILSYMQVFLLWIEEILLIINL